MSISILSIRCRVKPATPQEAGYTCWDVIKKAMDKQYPWCMKCEDSLWHVDMDGRRLVAAFSALAGKEVELVAEGTGEMLRYRIGIGFLNEAKENPA